MAVYGKSEDNEVAVLEVNTEHFMIVGVTTFHPKGFRLTYLTVSEVQALVEQLTDWLSHYTFAYRQAGNEGE